MAKRRITVRIDEADAQALEETARAARRATGDNIGLSDVLRDAIAQYLKTGDDNADRNRTT